MFFSFWFTASSFVPADEILLQYNYRKVYMAKKFIVTSLFVFGYIVSFSQKTNSTQAYPKITGFASIIHPIVTFDKSGSSFNFSKSYTVGFPIGINILKSNKIGFSFEITPYIKSQNDTTKVNFVLFHPGAMFRFKHNFTIITRLAFETTGRFGVTPVFNKVVVKAKNVNYFIAMSTPVRLGNAKPASIGLALQIGVSF
jgi:hypothetical protein